MPSSSCLFIQSLGVSQVLHLERSCNQHAAQPPPPTQLQATHPCRFQVINDALRVLRRGSAFKRAATLAPTRAGADDRKGCVFAISHESNIGKVKLVDCAEFSVNHTCVWNRFKDIEVPTKMPPFPEHGCISCVVLGVIGEVLSFFVKVIWFC